MATDHDDLRPEVKEAQKQSLEALQTASTPVRERGHRCQCPGGIIAEELVVQVVPPCADEFPGPTPFPDCTGTERAFVLHRVRSLNTGPEPETWTGQLPGSGSYAIQAICEYFAANSCHTSSAETPIRVHAQGHGAALRPITPHLMPPFSPRGPLVLKECVT